MRSRVKGSEEERLRLYHHGLSDVKIAAKLGMSAPGIRGWRQRRGLEPNYKFSAGKGDLEGEIWCRGNSVRMDKVLDERQCVVMRRFLGDLIRHSEGASKPDVGEFMKEWRRLYREGKIRI